LVEFGGREFGTKNDYCFVSTLQEFTVQPVRSWNTLNILFRSRKLAW